MNEIDLLIICHCGNALLFLVGAAKPPSALPCGVLPSLFIRQESPHISYVLFFYTLLDVTIIVSEFYTKYGIDCLPEKARRIEQAFAEKRGFASSKPPIYANLSFKNHFSEKFGTSLSKTFTSNIFENTSFFIINNLKGVGLNGQSSNPT